MYTYTRSIACVGNLKLTIVLQFERNAECMSLEGQQFGRYRNNNTFIRSLAGGFRQAINQSSGVSNVIAAVANGAVIDLYVNMQHLGSASDGTFSIGQIVAAAYNQGNFTEVVFSNAKVWTF